MSGGERRVTRIGRRALGIAAAGALLASLCRCDSGGGVGELRAACEERAPVGDRYWMPQGPSEAATLFPPSGFQASMRACDWKCVHEDAQQKCAELNPSSIGGFYTGRVGPDMSWELICVTQGAWKTAGTAVLRQSDVPLSLKNVDWARAGRAAQAICSRRSEGGEAGMPIDKTGRVEYRVLCLGHDTELWDVREQDIGSAVQSLGDWQVAGALAASLCEQRYVGTTGFFTGAGEPAAGTYQLACVPVRP